MLSRCGRTASEQQAGTVVTGNVIVERSTAAATSATGRAMATRGRRLASTRSCPTITTRAATQPTQSSPRNPRWPPLNLFTRQRGLRYHMMVCLVPNQGSAETMANVSGTSPSGCYYGDNIRNDAARYGKQSLCWPIDGADKSRPDRQSPNQKTGVDFQNGYQQHWQWLRLKKPANR